jgi:hypothetical protein
LATSRAVSGIVNVVSVFPPSVTDREVLAIVAMALIVVVVQGSVRTTLNARVVDSVDVNGLPLLLAIVITA